MVDYYPEGWYTLRYEKVYKGGEAMPRFSGVRMTYQGNVSICFNHRDAQENIDVCARALALLTGLDEALLFQRQPGQGSLFEQSGGRVEYYVERG